MKNIRIPFTEQQIITLKKNLNLSGIAVKHGLSPRSNHIYRILRTGTKHANSKSAKILQELREELDKINSNQNE